MSLLRGLESILEKPRPKLLIIGHGRHGKDTVAEIFNELFGLTFKSSSYAAAEIFMFDELKDEYGYQTVEECYEDRNTSQEKRDLWYNKICEYNKDNPVRLTQEILKTSDCYVGMRSNREVVECIDQEIFDLIIWVDASERLPNEASSSMEVPKEVADFIIDNNTYDPELKLLRRKIKHIGDMWFKFV